jgi:hypothetical protein
VKINQVLCGFGALMLALAPAAHATLLSPGLLSPGLANLEPTGFAIPLPAIPLPDDRTDHNGSNPIETLVAGTGVESINSTRAGYPLTGSFISEVYEEASGTLDFYYQVSIAPGSSTGHTSEDLFAFQPLSSVPEPVSLVLLGTTLALAALFIRRRRVVKASKTEIKS